MSAKDYYAVIGIEKTASADAIKKAYRKLVLKYHPDKIKDPAKKEEAKHKFQEVQEAYDVLSDEKKRASYDQLGHDFYKRQQQGGGGGGAGGFDQNFDFGDIFSGIFNQFDQQERHEQHFRRRGEDLKYSIEITLEEAFKGTQIKIKLPRMIACSVCAGNGKAKDSQPTRCVTCNGRGHIFVQQMFFNIKQTCHACGGSGSSRALCASCKGHGRVNDRNNMIDVDIPAGITDGMMLRLTGKGNAGMSGSSSGDLFIVVKIKKHDIFEIETSGRSNNIICTVPIDPSIAVIGDVIQVPTIDGIIVDVKIPAGAQHDSKIRIAGKGMPFLKSIMRADMFVKIKIEIPTSITSEESALWAQLKTVAKNRKANGVWAKIKDFLSKFS